jgi:hypothetical protein
VAVGFTARGLLSQKHVVLVVLVASPMWLSAAQLFGLLYNYRPFA